MADNDKFGFSLGVDDISISVKRVNGIWEVPEIKGCVLPKELHYAQMRIGKYYQGYRKKIAQAYNQSKSRERKKEADRVEKHREARAKENKEMTDSPSEIQLMTQVLENQGANDGRAE